MNNIKHKPPYGFIYMNILNNRNLNQTDKLIYGIMAAKQGTSDKAIITTKMFADALSLSEKTIRDSKKKLIKSELINKISRNEYSVKKAGGQYGLIEQDIIITPELSNGAKYLYLIYCASSNNYDANYCGRKMICKTFQMGNTTYKNAHKELIEMGLLETIAQASGPNTQTVNINIISRASKINVKIPSSWVPLKEFNLKKWCEENLDHTSQESETEVSEMENESLSNSKEEVLMQRSVTINSNHNNKETINDVTNEAEALTIDVSKTDLRLGEEEEKETVSADAIVSHLKTLMFTKLNTVEEAMPLIDQVLDIVPSSYYDLSLRDPDVVMKAFIAFDELIDVLDDHGISTDNYALNYDDIHRFVRYHDTHFLKLEDDIKYHVRRVAELGIDKENKEYISFSYVFGDNTDPKYEAVPQNGNAGNTEVTGKGEGDSFMYADLSFI